MAEVTSDAPAPDVVSFEKQQVVWLQPCVKYQDDSKLWNIAVVLAYLKLYSVLVLMSFGMGVDNLMSWICNKNGKKLQEEAGVVSLMQNAITEHKKSSGMAIEGFSSGQIGKMLKQVSNVSLPMPLVSNFPLFVAGKSHLEESPFYRRLLRARYDGSSHS